MSLQVHNGDALGAAAVAAADPTGQLADISGLGDHLRDALWRVESAGIRPIDAPDGAVVAGMGGSGIGGRLAIAALGPRARRPLAVVAGYALPPWTTPGTLVVCSSYSGNTEETLACYEQAGALGAPRVAVTTGGELAARARRDGVPVIPVPGGFQPRAAVGYSLVAVLESVAKAGGAPSLRDEVEAAAALAEALVREWGPEGAADGDAKQLARRLAGRIAVVAGADLTAPVAYRWKAQLNENAKLPAFASELPELDHNELVGWPASDELGRFAAVFLEDPEADERVRARFALTAEIAGTGTDVVARVTGRGETRLERLVSLVLLGDLVSFYAAVLRGVDPADIEVLSRLKAALAAG